MKTHEAELERLREAQSQSMQQHKLWQQVRTGTATVSPGQSWSKQQGVVVVQ